MHKCPKCGYVSTGTTTPIKNKQKSRLKNPAAIALGHLGGIAKSGYRINADDVRMIRASPLSGKELAIRYKVSPSAISQIRCRHTWGWVA